MAELELSMRARRCLNRRIDDRATLVTEVAREAARDEVWAIIRRQFTMNHARRKLHRLSPS
jgi:hypothetical protein